MQRINVAIMRQGLSAVYDWIARLREVGTTSSSNGSVGVSIGYGQWCLSRDMWAKQHMLL